MSQYHDLQMTGPELDARLVQILTNEQNIATETARAEGVEATKADKTDVYTKNEVYNKQEIDEMLGDNIQSLSWAGASISPSTVAEGGTATFTKGVVTATYRSGRTEDVTPFSIFTADRGTISGNTYIAPNVSGIDTISVSYGGEIAPDVLTVTVDEAPVFLDVSVGSGADYQSSVYTSTGAALSNNMIVTISNNAGDYLFLKVDRRQTVNNLFTYPGPNMEEFEYAVALDSPVESGEYKIYKTTNRYNAGSWQYKINKV